MSSLSDKNRRLYEGNVDTNCGAPGGKSGCGPLASLRVLSFHHAGERMDVEAAGTQGVLEGRLSIRVSGEMRSRAGRASLTSTLCAGALQGTSAAAASSPWKRRGRRSGGRWQRRVRQQMASRVRVPILPPPGPHVLSEKEGAGTPQIGAHGSYLRLTVVSSQMQKGEGWPAPALSGNLLCGFTE